MYARQIAKDDGEELTITLGVSGKLLDRVLIMYDRQTGSEWSHLTGEALAGPLKGEKLTPVSSVMCTLDEWVAMHPKTDVLAPEMPLARYRAHAARWSGYFRSREGQMLLGVVEGEHARAYHFTDLKELPVANDRVGEVPVLVAFDSQSETAIAWRRTVGDRTLTFDPAGDDRVRDRETGTVWNPFTGEAIEGALSGRRLTLATAIRSYEYGWRTYYPRSTRWRPGGAAKPEKKRGGKLY